MKKFKIFLAILLVASMIFTTNAVNVFAEGMNANQEEQLNEETTVGAKLGEPEEDETIVESKLSDPEEDIDENLSEPALEEEETEAELEEEAEETTVGSNEHGASPEDEENSTEAKLGESEIELELDKKKKDDQLYGDDPKKFYVVFYYNDENYSSWTLNESNINSVADDDEKQYFVDNLFDELIYNLSAAEPRGFYQIGDDTEYDINSARQAYNRWSDVTVELSKDGLLAQYESWLSGGAEHDVYYGTLINTYFYLLHYDSDGNPAFKKVKYDDGVDKVNEYIATIKGSAPSGKKFKTWQYWHADWYEEEGYDFSDDGEKEFYKNLVEDPDEANDDAAVIAMYTSWKDEPYENRHFGAIYEDDIFMYWKVDGAEDNPTIHYYATDGDGRTAVDFDENGVVYTSLSESERNSIKNAVFEEPIVASDVRSFFKDFEGLVSITDIEKLDTSNATSFAHMFDHCSAIEAIDVNTLNTDSLTDTSYMFTYCTSAKDIILGDNFDTSNVTSMREMFNATGAKELDLTNFDTSKVTNMYGMFSSCGNLETIRVSDKFVVDQVTSSSSKFMFNTCSKLVGEKGTKFTDTATPWDKTYAHIDGGTSNPGLFSGPAGTFMYWIVDGAEDKRTIHYYATAGDGRTPVEIGANGIVYTGLDNQEIEKIKYAVFENNETIVATDVRSYFAGFSGLESITDLGNLDTSKATSFANMFNYCGSIVNLDVSDLRTDSLNDTSRMFEDCRKVQTITFGNNFDTSKVTTMEQMFATCNKLTSLNFGNKFNTSNVTNMSNMFCAVGLEELDLTKFDTSKVTNMYGMFAESLELKTIKVSDKFVVDQVSEGDYMFVGCSNLVGGKGTTYNDTVAPWGKSYAHIDEGSTNPGFFTAAPTPTPPTPPTPSPSPSYGGNTGGGDSSGSSTDGPIKVTNNNMLTYTVNNIPQSLLLNDPALYLQLMSYPENTYMQKTNAKDIYGNTGYGRWLRIPNTTIWYFYAGDFNGVGNAGFLKDGWFNLGWDGVDRWYHFDSNGVMQLGWYEENGKIYFLQNDLNDNWYGKAVTGTHVIDGVTYTFDSTGALIQ